eukprot:15330467-Ditylum_brightwellii.AAC.1
MAMDLVCDVTGMEKEEEEDMIIKNDLSGESDEDATAAYTNFCMFMPSAKKLLEQWRSQTRFTCFY